MASLSESVHRIIVDRPSFNEKTLLDQYSFQKFKPENLLYSTKNYVKKYYGPNKNCMQRFLFNRLPIIKWIRSYNVKEYLLKDFIGGLTIGVVQIPQSMAYSIMAGLPPINGLYVTFFTVLVYLFFGTSNHLSLGTYGIVSLMVEASIENYEGKLYPKKFKETNQRRYGLDNLVRNYRSLDEYSENEVYDTSNFLSENPEEAKVMIAGCLAFFTGIIQIGFALSYFGVVTKYLSDVIVAAFTTGAAYHIVISQINSLLGIDIFHEKNPFKLVENLIEIFKEAQNTNIATLTISYVSMALLYTVKHYVNQKYKAKLIAPFPIELVIIVLGTLLSYFCDFNKRWKVKIVGNIPLGIPTPTVPPLKILPLLIGDAFSIAIVSFALNISMGKLFAKKYNYELSSNQELFSYGLGNLVSSFFKGFPSCVGLSRCVILEGTGAQTQLFSAISSVLVIVVIVGIGFLFRTLPICCLAAIIVVALLPMLTEIKQIIPIYKRSKLEAIAWIMTFLGVMVLDVDYGLYIGIAFSLLLVIFQSQRSATSVMGNIPKTDIYESIDVCEDAREIENVKIIRYESSIYYANVDNFVYRIIKISEVNPNIMIQKINNVKYEYQKKINKLKSNQTNSRCCLFLRKKFGSQASTQINLVFDTTTQEQALQNELDQSIENMLNKIKIKDIIIDCSCVNFIDSMGIDALIKLNENFKECRVQLHLTHCKRSILRTLNKSTFATKFQYDFIYPTTHDAVLHILNQKYKESSLNSSNVSSISFDLEDEKNETEPINPHYMEKFNVFSEIVS